jgi:hypothetical protein
MKMNQKIESFLHRRGFTHPDVRSLVRNQLYLAAGTCLIAAVVSIGFAPWALGLAAGAVLVTFNFWSLAKFGQHLAYMRKGAVVSLLIRFYGRLILSGLALYGLIVWGQCSIYALLAGLSTVVVNAIFWGVAGFRQKVKEA